MGKLYLDGKEVWSNIVMQGTWTGLGTVTLPAFTLGGAIAGGDQAFTGVGDMTFTAGSIIAAGATNADTLLFKAGGLSGTTFITLTSGATDVCTINAPTMSGTWLASGTVTMPAITLGGNVIAGNRVFSVDTDFFMTTPASGYGLNLTNTGPDTGGAIIRLYHNSASPANGDEIGGLVFRATTSTTADTYMGYMKAFITDVTHATRTSSLEWTLMNSATSNIPMTLSAPGALWTDLSVDTLTYKVSGTQVVGARVVDAAIDDAINAGAWDATTAGVLTAIRDAVVTHGLVAAA